MVRGMRGRGGAHEHDQTQNSGGEAGTKATVLLTGTSYTR